LHIGINNIIFSSMAKLVGYMLTWTTYGTWLQGDKRGFVKDGEILPGDETILELCKRLQKGPTVKFTTQEKVIVEAAILNEAERISHKIEALAVCTNHIHLAARPCDKSIERIVSMYKSAATRELRCYGRTGKIWTKGFDKRFCFTQEDLVGKIAYIQNHKQPTTLSPVAGDGGN
jgi:REP element-mobilizing transposase RayT